jgi:hypothetical protein
LKNQKQTWIKDQKELNDLKKEKDKRLNCYLKLSLRTENVFTNNCYKMWKI